jgi:hypothetical protein
MLAVVAVSAVACTRIHPAGVASYVGALPEPGPPGAELSAERCRSYLFYAIPLGPSFETREVLAELTREAPSLGSVTVDVRAKSWLLGSTECTVVHGREMVPAERKVVKKTKARMVSEAQTKRVDPVELLREVCAAAGRPTPSNIDQWEADTALIKRLLKEGHSPAELVSAAKKGAAVVGDGPALAALLMVGLAAQ